MTLPIMYATCFGLSILSALFPWMNGEVLMLSYSTLADSPIERFILVLIVSTGQIAGKCVLYWSGRGVIPLESGRVGRVVGSWRNHFIRYSQIPMWLVFISAVSGIPPFYIITVLAGAFRLQFARFIAVGACGRIVHFGAVALIPQFFPQLSHYLDNLF